MTSELPEPRIPFVISPATHVHSENLASLGLTISATRGGFFKSSKHIPGMNNYMLQQLNFCGSKVRNPSRHNRVSTDIQTNADRDPASASIQEFWLTYSDGGLAWFLERQEISSTWQRQGIKTWNQLLLALRMTVYVRRHAGFLSLLITIKVKPGIDEHLP
ncbi:hypothetical protein L218DRAFT_947226 [Marasmius fiardii PR-910]|nr:hypothetical protein L218DRAFT_947226 [Marasmius fiardii PR-910]